MRQRCIPQRARGAHVGLRRVEPRHLPVPARQRQIEQRLADGLRKLVGVLLGRGHVGDEGAQIDAQPPVERAFHRGAVDRRQHDPGDDENHHGPGRRREEQPKRERIKRASPGGSEQIAKSAHGLDDVDAELLADAADEDFDGVGIAIEVLVVEMLDQLGARHHAAGMVHEIREQTIFVRGELDRVAVDGDAAGAGVEPHAGRN